MRHSNVSTDGALNYVSKKKFTSLSKISFNTEYSCHTIINIKHE